MKKINIKQALIFTVIFLIGIFIVVEQGIYKKSLSKESVTLGVNLPSESVKPIVYDIANQGFPKRLVQPGEISIATGHGASGLINKGKEPIAVQVKAQGFTGNVQITSTDTSFVKETGKFTKQIQPGKELNLSVILDIPRNELNKNSVSTGYVEITDYNNGKVLANIPVNIINSNISVSK